MVAVQTEMSKEEEPGDHPVTFGSIRSGVEACNGACACGDSFFADGNYPAGGTLKMIGRAVTDECGRCGIGEFPEQSSW
jgi:hypothetical protein